MLTRILAAAACVACAATAALAEGDLRKSLANGGAHATSVATDAVPHPAPRPAPAPGMAKAASPPPAKAAQPRVTGIVHEELGKKYCIGGRDCEKHCGEASAGCEARKVYTVKLEKPAQIARIQLFAHDDVGASRRADLIVRVDGVETGKAAVYRSGSTVVLPVNRAGQLITVEATHNQNGFLEGGEEAVIGDIYVFGRPMP